jgi:fatty acid desaturase
VDRTFDSETEIAALGAEFDTIRRDVEESLGAHDATYIHRTIAFQRALEARARLLVAAIRSRAGWLLGTAALAFAKAVENMGISDNVGHGQWDWMNNPETHSTTWEWDMVGPSSQWRYSHNYRHHVFTNVLEMDDDLGFGVMRLSRDQPWRPRYLVQSPRNLLLAITFEWDIALHGIHAAQNRAETEGEKAHCWRSRAETCAIRSSTDRSAACPVTATPKSLPGCGGCATTSTCPHHWLALDQYLQTVRTI